MSCHGIRSLSSFQAVPYFEEVPGEKRLGDGFIVDLDALADEAQVGRRKQADASGRRRRAGRRTGWRVLRQYRGDEGAGRAFALCAGDVDEPQAVEVRGLRVPSAMRHTNQTTWAMLRGAHLISEAATPLDHLRNRLVVHAAARLADGIDNGEIGLQRVQCRDRSLWASAWRSARGGRAG